MIKHGLAICLLCLLLLGCNTDYDDEDRADSMVPYKELKIEVPGAEEGTLEKFHMEAYIRNYSSYVFGFDGLEDDEAVPEAKLTEEEDGSVGVEMILNGVEAEPKNVGGGGAAPVTDDGYFITAAHVASRESLWLVYCTDTSEKPEMACSKARIVFKDDKADFAIVKADIATKRYLEVRTAALKENELFFGGKWTSSSITAGNLLSTKEVVSKRGDERITFREIFSTNPIRGGDSGAPLIDAKGRVCGVLCGVYTGIFKKMKTAKARSVMLDREVLFKIINEDRAARRGG